MIITVVYTYQHFISHIFWYLLETTMEPRTLPQTLYFKTSIKTETTDQDSQLL